MSKLVPPVTVELDRPRTLVCDMAAVQKIEEWTGANLISALRETAKADDEKKEELAKQLDGPKFTNALLAAFLLHDEPAMTPMKAGQLVTSLGVYQRAVAATTEALSRFFAVPAAEPSATPAEIPNPTES